TPSSQPQNELGLYMSNSNPMPGCSSAGSASSTVRSKRRKLKLTMGPPLSEVRTESTAGWPAGGSPTGVGPRTNRDTSASGFMGFLVGEDSGPGTDPRHP